MKIGPVMERLQAQCPSLRGIYHASSVDGIGDFSEETPVAFVWVAGDRAEVPQVLHCPDQEITVEVAVRIYAVCDALAESEPMCTARDEIRRALMGWQPADADLADAQEFIFIGGRPELLTESSVQWLDTYQITHNFAVTRA